MEAVSQLQIQTERQITWNIDQQLILAAKLTDVTSHINMMLVKNDILSADTAWKIIF
jgi:hypothetical protein